MSKYLTGAVCAGVVTLSMLSSANAALIIQAETAVGSSSFYDYDPAPFLIDHSGLSIDYTAGDDFDAYIASNPVHDNLAASTWVAALDDLNVTIDFTFDQMYSFESIALWNRGTQQYGQDFNNQIGEFSLYSSNDASFRSLTLIDRFNPAANKGTILAVEAEVLGFSAVEATYLRMHITAAQPGGYLLSASEVVFDGTSVAPVPVPAAVWLFGSGLLGLAGVARRKAR